MIQAERNGPFVVLRDVEGRRHALRANAIIGISEADEVGDESVLAIQGGRLLLVNASVDEIVGWFA